MVLAEWLKHYSERYMVGCFFITPIRKRTKKMYSPIDDEQKDKNTFDSFDNYMKTFNCRNCRSNVFCLSVRRRPLVSTFSEFFSMFNSVLR